jgi:branched-chain amino acid transport system permease protein
MTGATTVDQPTAQLHTSPRRWGLAALVLLGAVAMVYGGSREYFTQQLIAIACIYAILALSLDLVWGYVGILSMGHAVFFGLGAYAVGLSQVKVTDTGGVQPRAPHVWNLPLGIIAGVTVVVLVALLVGAIAFYGKGSTPFYIAVVTLSLTVILSTMLVQTAFLGGQQGLSGFPILTISGTTWYYICALGLVASWILVGILVRSDFGVLLRAIRDNEQRCRFLGYDVARVKTLIFAASAGLAAVAGAMYAGYVGFVSPPFVGFMVATNIIIWVAVGGRGTLVGAVAGAIAINLGGANLSARFPYVWTLVLGLLFVLVVVVFPEGVLPGAARLAGKLTRRPGGLGHLLSRTRELAVRAPSADQAMAPVDGASTAATGPAMSIRDVHLSYGALQVLRGVTLDVRDGELLCIVGPNGAGKTSLLSVISDGSVPHEGSVNARDRIDGREISLRGMRPGPIVRAGIGRKFQNPNMFETLTPLETVLLASRRGSVPSLWRRTRHVAVTRQAAAIFRSTGLDHATNVPAQDLSHGLKQALEVAMTVSLEPTILLLDEPTAGLTLDERALVGDLLRELVAQGITIILIEHDFTFVRRIADRIAVLHDGKLLEIGSVDEIANSELVRRVYLGSSR